MFDEDQDETKSNLEKTVRLTAIEPSDIANLIILAMAVTFHGKTYKLRNVLHRLSVAFQPRMFFANSACQCGMPNCMNKDFGVIGYLDGYLDAEGIAHGTRHAILRFDPIATPQGAIAP